MILVLLLVWRFIQSQPVLGSFVGLQSIWDEQRHVGGLAMTLYNLAYNPVMINASTATQWPKRGEKFMDETLVALDEKSGLAYATVIVQDDDWNFKSQTLQTWQYKRNGEYILPEFLNEIQVASSSGSRILAMYYSAGKSTIYAVYGGHGGVDVCIIEDPKKGTKKVILHVDGAFPGYGGSAFDETSLSIVYPAGKNLIKFIDLVDLISYEIGVDPSYATTDGVWCKPDRTATCIGHAYYVPTPHEPAEKYEYEILILYGNATITSTSDIYTGGMLGYYESDLVTMYFDEAWYEAPYVGFLAKVWGTSKVVINHKMMGPQRPEFGYSYDPQMKVY